MKRLFVVCVAAMMLAGCRSAGQTTDPFFGRSTVEPPRTGVASGSRAPAYYSGGAAGNAVSTPRSSAVGTRSAPVGAYAAPSSQPTYRANPALTSSPSAAPSNQRLLPASGPMDPPRSSVPSQPSPWSSSQGYGQQTAPAVGAPATSAPLAPVGVQPQLSTPATGPTLRPAAAIPVPVSQGQCVPAYPCNPYYPCCPANSASDTQCSLAGRQRIVRPLQARQGATCPAGTVPVPCVPLYNPCRTGTSAGGATGTSAGGTINITDLPEPKPKT